jgi:hypothetical protein
MVGIMRIQFMLMQGVKALCRRQPSEHVNFRICLFWEGGVVEVLGDLPGRAPTI